MLLVPPSLTSDEQRIELTRIFYETQALKGRNRFFSGEYEALRSYTINVLVAYEMAEVCQHCDPTLPRPTCPNSETSLCLALVR